MSGRNDMTQKALETRQDCTCKLYMSTMPFFMPYEILGTILGSLEEVVENLVKTWEMEASHKKNMSQWTTIDYENYCTQSNGGCVVDGVTAYEIGNYNALMKDCPAYQKCKYFCFECT